MDRATVEIYERAARDYAARRSPQARRKARAFANQVGAGIRADLGCGAGRYTSDLGTPVVALDAARAMLDLAINMAPKALAVQADLEALPLGRGTLSGAWANCSYQHLRRSRLPMALADLHRALVVNSPANITMVSGTTEGPSSGDDFPGRMFALWQTEDIRRVLHGAGFGIDRIDVDGTQLQCRLRRQRTLPDVVGPNMRLLVCGLNPSLYAADTGVNFGRPGNRFWPAAVAAGLVAKSGDPFDALRNHGVGFTDLVKQATVAADVLTAQDYRQGLERLRWLVGWLKPQALCVVGLAGWRGAVDRRAMAGRQPQELEGVSVYVMPNTSGLNAHTRPAQFVEHLKMAAALAG